MSGNKVVPMENTALKAMALERQDAEGIEFPCHFTKEGTNPYDTVEWEERTAVIMSEKGEEIFRQDGVEVPKSWSQRATNTLSASISRLCRDAAAERSVRRLVERVASTIAGWGIEGYASAQTPRLTTSWLPAAAPACRVQFPYGSTVGSSPTPVLRLLHQLGPTPWTHPCLRTEGSCLLGSGTDEFLPAALPRPARGPPPGRSVS